MCFLYQDVFEELTKMVPPSTEVDSAGLNKKALENFACVPGRMWNPFKVRFKLDSETLAMVDVGYCLTMRRRCRLTPCHYR